MCFAAAAAQRSSLEAFERQLLGFTHCESGKILAEQWKFSDDVVSVIEFHHHVAGTSSAPALVCLVHLSDLLCRLRDLGYGFYEAMGVDLARDQAWRNLLQHCPQPATLDLARHRRSHGRDHRVSECRLSRVTSHGRRVPPLHCIMKTKNKNSIYADIFNWIRLVECDLIRLCRNERKARKICPLRIA